MSTDRIIYDDSVQSEFLKKIAPKLQNVRSFLNSGDPLLSNMATKSLGYVGGQSLPFRITGERNIDTILPPTVTKSKPKPKNVKPKKEPKTKKSELKKKASGSATPKMSNKSSGGGGKKSDKSSGSGGKKSNNSGGGKKSAVKKPKTNSVCTAAW